MKTRTIHEKVQRQEFFFDHSDLRRVVLEAVHANYLWMKPTADSHEEVDVEFGEDENGQTAKVTRRLFYDSAALPTEKRTHE